MAHRPHIRQARAADLDELVKLLQLLFSIEMDFEYNADRQRRGLEMLLEQDGAVILLAELKNRIIGMCTGQLLVSTAEGGFSLLAEDVVVDESWQRQGVGTQLLEGLEEWAREMNASRFQLLADRSNESGLKFYNKLNWQTTQLICLRKKVLTDNENKG